VILDTNGLSALVDGDDSLKPVLERADEICLPVIVLGEYIFGVRQSRERIRYEQWLSKRKPDYRILNIDEPTAEHYADIRLELKKAGKPIPVNDLWIAALARQHRSDILSRDAHFDVVHGLRRVSW